MLLIGDVNRKIFVYTLKIILSLISHRMEVTKMQWILTDIPLGRNIQEVRMERNMTQADVIVKLQLMGSIMSRSTLANIETGRRNIKASDLRLLKLIFNVDYEEFFRT